MRSPHSIAVLMKHLGDNHRSRWRNFPSPYEERAFRNLSLALESSRVRWV